MANINTPDLSFHDHDDDFNPDDIYEIEKYDDFLHLIVEQHIVDLSPYIFQEVDFHSEPLDRWNSFSMVGTLFFGCRFPDSVTPHSLLLRGAMVLSNDASLPFKPHRGFLYTQEEMDATSAAIYKYYKTHSDLRAKLRYTAHDFSISDALADTLSSKSVVSFMGGHRLSRQDDMYRQIVRISWHLARSGFIVATGGGPGAMEAGNLGAYLACRSAEDVELALRLIAEPVVPTSASSLSLDIEYLNDKPARRVIEHFGPPSNMPSIGIPTFFYGHEPSNLFASYHAKYFENALREDILIKVSNGGIIFAPGSAGTRQELFQAACLNHYAEPGREFPIIFLGKAFWTEPNIYDLFIKVAGEQPFAKWILSSDDPQQIISHIQQHSSEKALPLFSSPESSLTPHVGRKKHAQRQNNTINQPIKN